MSQLKRYNGTSWENVGGNIAPKTTTTSSDTDTYSCNYINGINEYSTTERVVGKWIDGRNIYEISKETNISGRNITINTIANLDFVIYCQTYLKRTGSYHNINSWGKETTDYGLMYVVNNNVVYDSSFTGKLYSTIRYVKTS